MGRIGTAATLAVGACFALAPASALAIPTPGDYREDDYAEGGAYNIVPPGQNGGMNALEAAQFELNGTRPPHQADQQAMYGDLVYTAPNLAEPEILDYFKDASFGVAPGKAEATYGANCLIPPAGGSPPAGIADECDDFTVVRDEFGVPHVYGDGRAGLMFGLGYVTGEDRLVLADVLRHAGRSELSSFAGGSNVGQDRDTFSNAPYMSDAELQLQYDRADDLYDEQYDGLGTLIQQDVAHYVAGLNQFIGEATLDPVNELDVVYAALGKPAGPEPWEVTDVIATGALVAGIFGKGGGGEVGSATSLQQARTAFGRREGKMIWNDFRSADDPEAPRTVHRGRFPYRQPPKGRVRGLAMPDPGSVEPVPTVEGGAPKVAAQPGGEAMEVESKSGEKVETEAPILQDILRALREHEGAGSNALLVSARESQGGHPTAVFGPQTSYFAPQLLMEQDSHAPSGPEGPGIDARGVAFVGANLYVQLGRGQDYSWSATSAGNDITDTYAVRLCEPGGDPAIGYSGYRWNGACEPIEVIKHENSWTSNLADQTPPGSETLQAFRTKAGLVTHLATIGGKPFAYTRLRATYFHEVDSAGAFAAWNSPEETQSAEDFTEHAFKNDLTFNWFYADDEQIAYVNSGANPKRPRNTSPEFPVRAKPKFMWRGWNPDLATFKREPLRRRPQVIDQRFLTSWNNKQARGYRNDAIRDYTSIYRSDPLDDRIKEQIAGAGKMSLVELINAMEDAGTVDLRGSHVLPWALEVIGEPSDPEQAAAVEVMHEWVETGAHRRDLDDSGEYDHAEAVKIMDAWWPLWVERQFEPTLGELHETFIGSGAAIHDAPRAQGSAFQGVVYGFAEKDLRTILGEKVRGRYSRTYCGEGDLAKCRTLLRETLEQAAATSFEDVYGTTGCTFFNGTAATPQMCGDAVDSVDLTLAAVPKFHWINRPTFQQAVQYPSGR
jgi:acyl-homoserine lactone acylase PvdQ